MMLAFILTIFFTSNPAASTQQRIVGQYDTWQECEAAGKKRIVDPYMPEIDGIIILNSGTVLYSNFPTDYRCDPLPQICIKDRNHADCRQ